MYTMVGVYIVRVLRVLTHCWLIVVSLVHVLLGVVQSGWGGG